MMRWRRPGAVKRCCQWDVAWSTEGDAIPQVQVTALHSLFCISQYTWHILNNWRHETDSLQKISYRKLLMKITGPKYCARLLVLSAGPGGRSPAETVCSNPTGGMDVCLL